MPNPLPAIVTRAPESARFVRRSLTHTRLRVEVTVEYAATSVTWRTVCRAIPAWVTVTTYQPMRRLDGSLNQPCQPSSTWLTRTEPSRTSGSVAVCTGVVLLRIVQSGASFTRRQAATAAVRPGRRWTTMSTCFTRAAFSSRSMRRPIAARSPGIASNRDRATVTWARETALPVVSKRMIRVSRSAMPVSATGSPRRTVTVYSVLRASGLSGT